MYLEFCRLQSAFINFLRTLQKYHSMWSLQRQPQKLVRYWVTSKKGSWNKRRKANMRKGRLLSIHILMICGKMTNNTWHTNCVFFKLVEPFTWWIHRRKYSFSKFNFKLKPWILSPACSRGLIAQILSSYFCIWYWFLDKLKCFVDHNQVLEVFPGREYAYVHIFSGCCSVWNFPQTKHPN